MTSPKYYDDGDVIVAQGKTTVFYTFSNLNLYINQLNDYIIAGT